MTATLLPFFCDFLLFLVSLSDAGKALLLCAITLSLAVCFIIALRRLEPPLARWRRGGFDRKPQPDRSKRAGARRRAAPDQPP